MVEGQYNGKTVTEVVSRSLSLYDGTQLPDEPETTGIEMIKTAILENNIGYLRLDGFGGTQMEKLLEQTMDRLAATDGLIIDLRKNGGGDLSGNVLLSRLTNKTINRFYQRAIYSDMENGLRPGNLFDYQYKEGKFTEIKARIVSPANESKQYKKPVLVLTSAYCFSACDTFVSAIKENKLGQIMGETTGGGTGNPQTIRLPISQHTFRYSVAQGFTAVGKSLLEGSGTQPDILLEPTIEERILGTDSQLEKAVQFFSNKLINTSNGNSVIVVTLPDSLRTVKAEQIKKPYDLEIDREVRKSKD